MANLATEHFFERQAFSMRPWLPSFRAKSSESRSLKLLGVQNSSTSPSAALRAALGMTEYTAVLGSIR